MFDTRTLIPPKHGRPTKKLPRQYYRRRMARIFRRKRKRRPYRQRAQVETVFSQVKRRLESSVNAHSYWSQCRALMLKALVHNIMLLRRREVFDRASDVPFVPPPLCASTGFWVATTTDNPGGGEMDIAVAKKNDLGAQRGETIFVPVRHTLPGG